MSDKLILLAIDGTNILRTVYEANPAPDSDEKAEGALNSALSSFRRALREHSPTHVLAAFDSEKTNWRHDIYSEYKLTRSPMPRELRDKIPKFFDMLKEIGISPVQAPGFEAEDIVATGFHRWRYGSGGEGKGECIILSSDKDLIILVAEGAQLRDHFKDVLKDEEYVVTRYGIGADRFADFQALTGDATDSIPGVSKIGAKTAAKLLNEYGSLMGVLDAAENIKGKVGENLRNERGLAILSRKLVDLKRDVPLGVSWNMLSYIEPATEKELRVKSKKHYSNGENAFGEESEASQGPRKSMRP